MNWIIYTHKLGRKGIPLFRLIILIIAVQFSYNQGFSQNCQRTTFRSIDGTCNNIGIGTKDWGAADIPVFREMPANYASSNVFNDMVDWPNPRKISNTVFPQTTSVPSKNGLSSFVFTWGQFIDHDMVFSPEGSEEQIISLPSDELDFTTDISFTRSAIFPGTGIFSARDQINEITSWIDASQVYGSDAHRANWLRTFKDGKLKVSTGNLLPFNTIDGEATSAIDPDAPEMGSLDMGATPHFVAGDVRAGEQPGLTALHTLFVREHNRICEVFRNRGVSNDEVLYQLARKQVGAIIQAITYNEFLPALGVRLSPYAGYNANVQPDLMTEFATAAYRIGHTMVTEDLLLLNDDCSKARENLSLEQAFFNGRWIAELGLEPFLKGLSVQVQEEIDAKVIDGLRNFLFAIPQLPGTFGLDLAALNIQRGRDHGLQDYNSMRAYFTGNTVRFNQINRDPAIRQALRTVYNGDINKVDAWVGMLCEEHLPNSNMGPTLHSILKLQFERSRDGDFYYYKNDPHFRPAEKLAIEQTSLADVIHNNTTLTSIQANAFKADSDNCGPTNSDLTTVSCGTTTIVYGNGTINMSAPAGKTYYFQVFDKSWRTVFSCGWQCGNSKTVENLESGTYRVFIYNDRWQPICRQVIELGGSTGPVDVDGDGVPAGTDCNDNDANLTVTGADCNDGNPNTINDKVNGKCHCEGTITNPNTQSVSCGEATITYGNASIAINGKAGTNYKIKVERILPSWISVENCVGTDCGFSKNYTNLSPGTYVIRMWTASWAPMCDVRVVLGQNLVDNNTISQRSGDAVFVNNNLDLIGSTLYPNPATNKAYLTLPDYIGQSGEVILVNNLGQQLLNQRLNKITAEPIELDIQRLAVGIYQLQTIIDGQYMVNHKLVIKR